MDSLKLPDDIGPLLFSFAQLFEMERSEPKKHAFAAIRQSNYHGANARFGSLAFDEAHFGQAVYELNSRIRLKQKLFGQLSDGNRAVRSRFDRQDRLVLLGRHAFPARGFLAERQKSPQRTSKAGQRSYLPLLDFHQRHR
jgi:hypothetical protein